MPRSDEEDRHRSSRRHGSGSKRSREEYISDDGDSYEGRRRKHHKKSKKHSRSDRDRDRKHQRKEKRRYEDDDSDDSHRNSKRSSRKDKKSSSKKSKKEGGKVRKAKLPNKKFLIHMGDPLGKAPSPLLDSQKDYFAFHQHLFVYLHREEGLAFNDLTSSETHQAFERFVEKYNRGILESDYYKDPLPAAALEEAKTTKHKWSFQTSHAEEDNLHAVQAGVRKQTQAAAKAAIGTSSSYSHTPKSSHTINNERSLGMSSQDRPSRDWAAERTANRRLREHVRTAEEEFGGGRKEGRERQIEKRKEEAERMHGASRDREAGVEIGDDALYGDSGSDFQKALAREKQKTAARREKQLARAEELQAKEKGKQEEMLKMLGLANLKPGQKIKIAPRND